MSVKDSQLTRSCLGVCRFVSGFPIIPIPPRGHRGRKPGAIPSATSSQKVRHANAAAMRAVHTAMASEVQKVLTRLLTVYKPSNWAGDPPVRVSVWHALTLCTLPSLQVWGHPGPACRGMSFYSAVKRA